MGAHVHAWKTAAAVTAALENHHNNSLNTRRVLWYLFSDLRKIRYQYFSPGAVFH